MNWTDLLTALRQLDCADQLRVMQFLLAERATEEGVYNVKKIDTILTVPSIEETVAWYKRVLGWDGGYDVADNQGRWLFGGVTFGDAEQVVRGEAPFQGFNLARVPEGDDSYQNTPTHFTALIFVDDAEAVYGRVIEQGITPDTPPQDQFWGARTFSMLDLNGFRLTFAQETEIVSQEEMQQRHQDLLQNS